MQYLDAVSETTGKPFNITVIQVYAPSTRTLALICGSHPVHVAEAANETSSFVYLSSCLNEMKMR